jgi:hypothetical protein
MKLIRSLHLYLGCLFAPLMLLYALSGAVQVYRLNDAKKDGSYTPPVWLKTIADVHTHQKLPATDRSSALTISKAAIGVGAGLALGVMALSGIVMAYKFTRNKWTVTFFLAAGIALPVIFLYLRL